MINRILIPFLSLLLVLHNIPCEAQLSATFYDGRCPNATTIIRNSIRRAISAERRMAASLIRLHFHDCFVQGCDASILLDETSTIQSEKTAGPNSNSVRGYEVIEAAKRDVERACPGVVSCADVLTLAARDASVAVGGPSWTVRLGRRDSTTASRSGANTDLPSPFAALDDLISAFRDKNLTPRDMVALSGAHTLGQSQCFLFRGRIYSNGTDIDAGFASTRRRQCPQSGGDSNLAPLDLVTPNSFDNNYFRNLVQRKGLLQSDQVLLSGSTADIVTQYSGSPATFAADFATAMIKMSEIQPLLGESGIIRRVCNAIN
ncbi:Peroxidase superfamily protein [Perilla frutescens var. hirtella]|uniref:Peroxidase n=1 Tax=Perilla frutescens var. hirtella TaxID=608512 RepID=A0AAD4NYN7_PERFH|nr:Peroxidase superfamily protein [Perilla frutescens var. hirtella]KAH6805551.1 Peroxidase superfamily protein [Perilla frutescens var. frutescens]KAH6820568.1 Peroxidase superfamily protein [Perilla frutescens var. hirtella]